MCDVRADAEMRLFCLPCAGGNARFYWPLQAELPTTFEIISLEYPGHGRRSNEACCTNFAALIDDCYAQIAPRAREGRFMLFGHSMGAVLAHRCARLLEDNGLMPAGALLSSPPVLIGPVTPVQMGSDELMNCIVAMKGMSPLVLRSPELRAYMETLLRADFTALLTWENPPAAVLHTPLTITGGDDGDVSLDALLHWGARTRGAFHTRLFTGGHFYIEEQWPALAALLCRMAGIAPRSGGADA